MSVSTALPLDQCAVCTVSGVNDTQTSCHSSLFLAADEEVKLLFNCSEPIEQAFTVTIIQTIGEFRDDLSLSNILYKPHTYTFSMICFQICYGSTPKK